MAGVAGIEPTIMVLETIVIPFNYTPMYFVIIQENKVFFKSFE